MKSRSSGEGRVSIGRCPILDNTRLRVYIAPSLVLIGAHTVEIVESVD